jgi:anti-sigma factor RsiW
MSQHVLDWLAAYHDGELHSARSVQVEAHLLECPACRAELEALRSLSTALQKNPVMPARTPPERFVAQVRLRARPSLPPPAQQWRSQADWLLVPLSVLGIGAFLQAVLIVSSLGLIVFSLFGGIPGTQPAWFPVVVAAQLFVLNVVLTAGLATLLWGWLAGWWAARSRQNLLAGETVR